MPEPVPQCILRRARTKPYQPAAYRVFGMCDLVLVIWYLFLGYRGLSRPASVFSMMMMMMMMMNYQAWYHRTK